MQQQYHTLAERTGNAWFPQFGDFDRDTVEEERRSMIETGEAKARDLRVVVSGPDQSDVNAAVARLNGRVQ